jgi:hypothetical protein
LYFEQMTKQKYHYRKKCGGRGTLSGQQLLDQPTPLSSGEGRPFLHRRTDARSPALTVSPTRAAERARGLPPGPPLREVPERHARDLRVRVRLSRMRVPDGIEEVLHPAGEAQSLSSATTPIASAGISSNQAPGGKPIALAMASIFS